MTGQNNNSEHIVKIENVSIPDLVKAAVIGDMDIPEFQRSFVWKPDQVRDLAESISNNYPIGSLLCWSNPEYMDSRQTVVSHQREWIIDGQQRVTALCFIVGRKPHWYKDKDWKFDFNKYETWVDITSPIDELVFETRRSYPYASKRWISIREIIKRSDNDLYKFVSECKKLLPKKFNMISESIISDIFLLIRNKFEENNSISAYCLPKNVINHDLESVATIFTRLNAGGTPVKETDTILAYISTIHKGWVKKEFLPFQESIEETGFDFDASIIVRTITGIGTGKTRIKEVPKAWWKDSNKFSESWKKTKDAIRFITKLLQNNYGIITSDLLPTKNALIPLFVLHSKYGSTKFKERKAIYWYLLATWYQRFGGASSTTLDEDIRTINKSRSFTGAIRALVENIDDDVTDEIQQDDFEERHTDRFLRLLYYMAANENRIYDPINKIKIGYNKKKGDANIGYQPEWHHIFPRAYLKKNGKNMGVDEINAFANIMILGSKSNQAIGKKAPKDYLREYNVKNEFLHQQFIPVQIKKQSAYHYRSFIKQRSKILAKQLTNYLQGLNK
jgi:hypothetical protein